MRLDLSAVGKETASSWQPLDTTMLRYVCLVGPGEEQLDLKQLERIRNGQHWVEFGILFGHHGVPERKPNAKEGGTLLESYDYVSKASDVILKKYPRLTKIAEVLQRQGASSRMRFCAHLLEDPFDRHLLEENGGEFLRWLVDCGFRKVLLHLNSNIRDYSESQVEEAVKKLQNMMEKYKDKDFTLVLSVPDNIMDKAKMLLNRLLQKGPATKVSVLYNSSRGGGAESTVYKGPVRDTKLHVTGYAGGFDPDNVVTKLADLRLIIPEGRQIFIEAQSKLRQNATKDSPGDFSIDLCRKFVRKVAESDFNPGMCREVYAQHDGSIILGSFDPPLILEPDQLYTVTSHEKSMFSLRHVAGHKVTPPIAGSVATRFLLSVTDGGCKVLPPQLERPGDSKRMQQDKYLFPPVTADKLRDFLQQPCRSCLKIVREPARPGPPYRGETPLRYLRTLLEASEDEVQMAKAIPPRDDDYATKLLRRWSQGLVASMDDGAGGQGHVSVASAGFGSRARKCNVFKSRDEDGLAGRGVAIVSIPGAHSELYNTVTRICLEDGMHFAIVWLSEWGDAWFYAWLRSVTEAMLHGCVPSLFSSQQTCGVFSKYTHCNLALANSAFFIRPVDTSGASCAHPDQWPNWTCSVCRGSGT